MGDAPRAPWDRVLDVAFALTVFGWSVAVVTRGDRPLGVALALAATNVVVGVLFLRRTGPLARASALDVASAVPSIVLSGAAYRFAAPEWPLVYIIAHAAFALIAITSLVTLGRSFAVLPGRRAIVARGPYRLVRNPIYLGELGMIVTACATRGWPEALAALGLGTLLLIPRIVLEERSLGADPAYEEYRAAVRYRLLPGMF